jgi:hypothetical protein
VVAVEFAQAEAQTMTWTVWGYWYVSYYSYYSYYYYYYYYYCCCCCCCCCSYLFLRDSVWKCSYYFHVEG